MDFDGIPFYRRLTFKFLAGTALFILLVEVVLFFLSLEGMTHRLIEIRQTVLETIPPVSDKVKSMILPSHQINGLVWEYGRNIALMVGLIVLVVVSGMYFLVRYWGNELVWTTPPATRFNTRARYTTSGKLAYPTRSSINRVNSRTRSSNSSSNTRHAGKT